MLIKENSMTWLSKVFALCIKIRKHLHNLISISKPITGVCLVLTVSARKITEIRNWT